MNSTQVKFAKNLTRLSGTAKLSIDKATGLCRFSYVYVTVFVDMGGKDDNDVFKLSTRIHHGIAPEGTSLKPSFIRFVTREVRRAIGHNVSLVWKNNNELSMEEPLPVCIVEQDAFEDFCNRIGGFLSTYWAGRNKLTDILSGMRLQDMLIESDAHHYLAEKKEQLSPSRYRHSPRPSKRVCALSSPQRRRISCSMSSETIKTTGDNSKNTNDEKPRRGGNENKGEDLRQKQPRRTKRHSSITSSEESVVTKSQDHKMTGDRKTRKSKDEKKKRKKSKKISSKKATSKQRVAPLHKNGP